MFGCVARSAPVGCWRMRCSRLGRAAEPPGPPPTAAPAYRARPQHQHSAGRAKSISCRMKSWWNSTPAPAQPISTGFARSLQLTPLETQTLRAHRPHVAALAHRRHALGGRYAARMSRFCANFVGAGEFLYLGQQGAPASTRDSAADAAATQYVVSKLHLLEAHRISSGDDVLVAVIDSQIDTKHPDLAGVIADQYDVIGTPPAAHSHGTAHGRRHRRAQQAGRRCAESEAARGARLLRRAATARRARPSTSSRGSIGPRARTRASSI